jgi:hypothetical protein
VRRTTLALVAALASTITGTAAAQSWSARALADRIRVQRPALGTDTTVALQGNLFGIRGAYGVGPVTLGAAYAQGSVSPSGNGASTDVVDGELMVWVAPVKWAALGGGPHARAFVENGATERWLLWELRARTVANLVNDAARAYVEAWRVMGGSIPSPDTLDHAWGLEGGISVAFGRFPVSAQLHYRVEQQVVSGGSRKETQDRLGIGVGIGAR